MSVVFLKPGGRQKDQYLLIGFVKGNPHDKHMNIP
jgi:hypothetical protein